MGSTIPVTERARSTRKRLLRCARRLVEIEGYDATSVSRIVDLAGVSRGTFYLYFDSKRDVVTTLMREVQGELVHLQDGTDLRRIDHEERIRRIIASFLDFYRRNAGLLAAFEQMAVYDDEFREARLEMRRGVAKRARALILHLQEEGRADQELDPRYAAAALTGMVDRFAFVWFNLNEDFDHDVAVFNLARLWLQAIGYRLA